MQFLFIVLFYLIIKVILLGLGVGVGFLLHWLFPAVDLGMGILVGVVTTGLTVHFFMHLMGWVEEVAFEERLIDLIPPSPPQRGGSRRGRRRR